MKKRICLLITLVISLFIFSGRVDAAKELTCVYENGVYSYVTMLVQTKNGDFHYYIVNEAVKDVSDINYSGWKNYKDFLDRDISFHFDYTTLYDRNSKDLTECPKFTTGYMPAETKDYDYSKIYFFDEETKEIKNFFNKKHRFSLDERLSCENCLPNIVNVDTGNVKWIAKCVYYDNMGTLTLYFNETMTKVENKRTHISVSSLDFSGDEIYKYYINTNYCPYELYELYIYDSNVLTTKYSATYYFDKPVVFNFPLCVAGECSWPTYSVLKTLTLDRDAVQIFDEKPENPKLDIDDCKDLFGDDLINKINQVMDYIKIAVPILLIGFGIIDFTKAMFAGSDDDMNKSKRTFFRRIVAAILVFIVPIFINLILSLANEVWEYISPDACIDQSENNARS